MSQWSHNFRPSYLRLGQTLDVRLFCGLSETQVPPLLMLYVCSGAAASGCLVFVVRTRSVSHRCFFLKEETAKHRLRACVRRRKGTLLVQCPFSIFIFFGPERPRSPKCMVSGFRAPEPFLPHASPPPSSCFVCWFARVCGRFRRSRPTLHPTAAFQLESCTCATVLFGALHVNPEYSGPDRAASTEASLSPFRALRPPAPPSPKPCHPSHPFSQLSPAVPLSRTDPNLTERH